MIVIKGMEKPKGCQHCMYFRKHLFGAGIDYSYSCLLGATEIPMPWFRQGEERAGDCPLTEIVTCEDCDHCRFELVEGIPYYWCDKDDRVTSEDFFCKDAERRE